MLVCWAWNEVHMCALSKGLLLVVTKRELQMQPPQLSYVCPQVGMCKVCKGVGGPRIHPNKPPHNCVHLLPRHRKEIAERDLNLWHGQVVLAPTPSPPTPFLPLLTLAVRRRRLASPDLEGLGNLHADARDHQPPTYPLTKENDLLTRKLKNN